MSIVVDMSLVLAWFFEEAQTSQALKILGPIAKEGMLVPPLWWSELENGILMGERRGRKKLAESEAFLKIVRNLPIQTDESPRQSVSNKILDLGRRHQLSAYDAAYVELALRESAPLATFDAALRRCAPQLKIRLLPTE